MRILAILAVTFMGMWGCQHFKPAEPMPEMEMIRITPEPVEERPLTMIEALRKACLEDGYFTIEYKGDLERYECYRAP